MDTYSPELLALRDEVLARRAAIYAALVERAERIAALVTDDAAQRDAIAALYVALVDSDTHEERDDALHAFASVTGRDVSELVRLADEVGVLRDEEGFTDEDVALRCVPVAPFPTTERFPRVDTERGVAVRGHRWNAYVIASEHEERVPVRGTVTERIAALRTNRATWQASPHRMLTDEVLRRADLMLRVTADAAHPYVSTYNLTDDVTTGTYLVGTDDYSWAEVRTSPTGESPQMGASIVGRDSSRKPRRFTGTRVTFPRGRFTDERTDAAVRSTDDADARACGAQYPTETVHGAVWQTTAGSRGWRVLKRYGTSARVLRVGETVRSTYAGTRLVPNGDGTYSPASVLRYVTVPRFGTLRFVGYRAIRPRIRRAAQRTRTAPVRVADGAALIAAVTDAAQRIAAERNGATVAYVTDDGARVTVRHEVTVRTSSAGVTSSAERLRVTVTVRSASGAAVRTMTTVRSADAAIAAVRNRVR